MPPIGVRQLAALFVRQLQPIAAAHRPLCSTTCRLSHRPNYRPPAIPRRLLAEYLRDASAGDGDPMVSVQDGSGGSLGAMRRSLANVKAVESDMRLIEMDGAEGGGRGDLPVYRIVARSQVARYRRQRSSDPRRKVKTMRLRSTIAPNMLGIKLMRANKWLDKGHKVFVQIAPSRAGYEQTHTLGNLVKQIGELVRDKGTLAGVAPDEVLAEKEATNFMILPKS